MALPCDVTVQSYSYFTILVNNFFSFQLQELHFFKRFCASYGIYWQWLDREQGGGRAEVQITENILLKRSIQKIWQIFKLDIKWRWTPVSRMTLYVNLLGLFWQIRLLTIIRDWCSLFTSTSLEPEPAVSSHSYRIWHGISQTFLFFSCCFFLYCRFHHAEWTSMKGGKIREYSPFKNFKSRLLFAGN